MEFKDIFAVAFATLIVLIVTHFAVFWVVRTLYPPAPAPVPVPEAPKPIFVQQAAETQQNVSIPTYEASIPMEAPRQEGATPIGDLSRDPVQRDAGVAPPNA